MVNRKGFLEAGGIGLIIAIIIIMVGVIVLFIIFAPKTLLVGDIYSDKIEKAAEASIFIPFWFSALRKNKNIV